MLYYYPGIKIQVTKELLRPLQKRQQRGMRRHVRLYNVNFCVIIQFYDHYFMYIKMDLLPY